MCLKVGSIFLSWSKVASGLNVNCMIERTDRAGVPPSWYIVVFFFNNHQAGGSSHMSARSPKSKGRARSDRSSFRSEKRKIAIAAASDVPRTFVNGNSTFRCWSPRPDISSNRASMSRAVLPRPI